MPNLIWFREADLRINDNTALYHASQLANDGLIALFIISPQEWEIHDMAACRIDFLLRHLETLSKDLNTLNIPLIIESVPQQKNIPTKILEITKQYKIQHLFFNLQYGIDEQRRDKAVTDVLQKYHIAVTSYTDQVILAPGEVRTQTNNYFTVFTPFKKAWIKKLQQIGGVSILPKPKLQKKLTISPTIIPINLTTSSPVIDPTLWPVGEAYAQKQLELFIATKIKKYKNHRDFPAETGTSQLSPYLTSGIISPRQCLHAALNINHQKLDTGNEGIITWINELIWREFYQHILYAFPRVSMNKPFQLITEKIKWENNEKLFLAWQQGKTGFPIIDAAMRQLNQIGWMHNRCRMLVAMFLTKNLLIDWRWGEKYFMQHLIDGDLAANNGGWQWCASTGTDAAPYFRIFNPITQSQKFDPDGVFIKTFCPELKNLDSKEIHDPSFLPKHIREKLDYPYPCIDLAASRERAITIFKNLKKS